LIQSITHEDNRECLIELTRDGITLTLSFQMILLKNNKDIVTISKLICKTIEKTRELKR